MQTLWNSLETISKWIIALAAITACAIGIASMSMQQLFPVDLSPRLPNLQVNHAKPAELATPGAYLFGTAPVIEQTKEEVKETKLNLVLKGVFPASSASLGMAVIAERGQPDKLLQTGETVSRGVTLDSVYSDHVVIVRGGIKESLFFEEHDAPDLLSNAELASNAGASSNNTRLNQKNRGNLGVLPGSARSAYQKLSGDISRQRSLATNNAPIINDINQLSVSQMIDKYEAQFRSNPQGLLSSSGLIATGSSYKVSSSSPLIGIGLKPGDEILSVNGQKVGNVSTDAGLGNVMRQQGVARIEMRRGSRRFFVNYPIR